MAGQGGDGPACTWEIESDEQVQVWNHEGGNVDLFDAAHLANGREVIAGSYRSTSFDITPQIALPLGDGSDCFVAWVEDGTVTDATALQTSGTGASCQVMGLAVLDNEVIVVGRYQAPDGGVLAPRTLTAPVRATTASEYGAFAVHYNDGADPIKHTVVNASGGSVELTAAVVDGTTIRVGGWYQGTPFVDDDTTQVLDAADGDGDVFLASWDTALTGFERFGGPGDQTLNDIAVAPGDRLVMTGSSDGAWDGVSTADPDMWVALVRVDVPMPALEWTEYVSSTGVDDGNAIAVQPGPAETFQIYAAGEFAAGITGVHGTTEGGGAVVVLDENGARTDIIPIVGTPGGGVITPLDIVITDRDEVIVVGGAYAPGIEIGGTTITHSGPNRNGFAAILSADRELSTGVVFGTTMTGSNYESAVRAVSGSGCQLLFAGSLGGGVRNMAPLDLGLVPVAADTGNNRDAFVLRLGP